MVVLVPAGNQVWFFPWYASPEGSEMTVNCFNIKAHKTFVGCYCISVLLLMKVACPDFQCIHTSTQTFLVPLV